MKKVKEVIGLETVEKNKTRTLEVSIFLILTLSSVLYKDETKEPAEVVFRVQ